MNITIFKIEIREHRSFLLGWAVALTLYNLLMIAVYPGEKGMQDMLNLLDDPIYEAVLGDIGGKDPSFALWVSLISPFMAIILFIFSLMLGNRIAMKSITDNTNELIDSTPITRNNMLFTRIITGIAMSTFLLIFYNLPLLIPIDGKSIDLDRIVTVIWWGILYMSAGMALGTLVGLLTSDLGKGNQNSLLLVLFLYTIQIVIRFQDQLADTKIFGYNQYSLLDLLNDINPLGWYGLGGVILGQEVDEKYIWFILAMFVLSITLAFIQYNRRDLIKNRGVDLSKYTSKLKFWKRFGKSSEKRVIEENGKTSRSVRNSIFTFWVRPIENRFPIAADFVYSDRRALMILFIALILFWPLQLIAYPGDAKAQEAITAFGTGGIFNLFTYGEDLGSSAYLWWMATQTVNVHWMMYVPLSLFWVKKVASRDGEDVTGDLVGSLPISNQRVIYERLLAVLLELIYLSVITIIWLILSEEAIDKTYNLTWEIIAILGVIPLYFSVVVIGTIINLQFKENGIKYARYFVYVGFLLLIVGYSAPNNLLSKWYVTLLFGLYNPTLLITEQSISVANYGLVILSVLSIISLIVLRKFTDKYSWIKIEKYN